MSADERAALWNRATAAGIWLRPRGDEMSRGEYDPRSDEPRNSRPTGRDSPEFPQNRSADELAVTRAASFLEWIFLKSFMVGGSVKAGDEKHFTDSSVTFYIFIKVLLELRSL